MEGRDDRAAGFLYLQRLAILDTRPSLNFCSHFLSLKKSHAIQSLRFYIDHFTREKRFDLYKYACACESQRPQGEYLRCGPPGGARNLRKLTVHSWRNFKFQNI